MEEPYATSEKVNGEKQKETRIPVEYGGEGLYDVVKGLLWSIFCPDHTSSLAGTSLYHRTKTSVRRDLPRLRDSSKTAGFRVLAWAREGSPLRALLVISAGTIALLSLTGLLVFMLFFVAATINAIVISLLMSLAAAGGFLALFFACMVAIYIGALSIALFVISTATFSAVIAVLVATGWVGFFWTVWFVTKRSARLAKKSINMTGSALSVYSSAWHTQRHNHHHE